MKTKGRIFVKWTRQRKELLLFYLTVLLLLPVAVFLYDEPGAAVLYGLQILTVLFAFFCIYDFLRFQKAQQYFHLLEGKSLLNDAGLPKAASPLEEDYHRCIEQLREEYQEQIRSYEMEMQEINDYYTMWVHQIKTPIAASCLVLDNEEVTAEEKRILRQEMFRIEGYVDMVLQYIRVRHLSNDLELHPCSLQSIVTATVKKYADIFIYKRLKVEIAEDLGEVLSDQKWLALIVEQILSNALKYTKEGSIRIYQEGADCLVIADTGIGIRSEDQTRIFERGFTGWNGRVGEKSSGLGLFLCKKAADKLGHRLAVESEPGRGTRMKILFDQEKFIEY